MAKKENAPGEYATRSMARNTRIMNYNTEISDKYKLYNLTLTTKIHRVLMKYNTISASISCVSSKKKR